MCRNHVFKEQVSEIKRAENKRIPQPEMDANPALAFGRPKLGKEVWGLKITVGTSMQGTSMQGTIVPLYSRRWVTRGCEH
jgi:hypothetical protein